MTASRVDEKVIRFPLPRFGGSAAAWGGASLAAPLEATASAEGSVQAALETGTAIALDHVMISYPQDRASSDVERLQARVLALESRVRKQIGGLARGTVIVVDTLAPAPLNLATPFHVNVDPCDDGFRASFTDANLMAFGDTAPEALWNLKDLIVATFETLSRIGEEQLGPGPARQLALLNQFVRK